MSAEHHHPQPVDHRNAEPRLDLDEDMQHQLRSWHIQRIGWICIAGVCGLALLGLFGDGWAADVTEHRAGLELRYQRFLRLGTSSDLLIKAPQGEWPSSLYLDSGFLEWADITDVEPRRDALKPTALGLAVDTASMDGFPALRIHFQPKALGRHSLRFSNSETVILNARCWVHP